MPPLETYESGIGSQPTMCQVHTGAYVSLLAPEKTDYIYRLPPKKDYHVHIARTVVPITTYTHDRRKSIGKKSKEKKRR